MSHTTEMQKDFSKILGKTIESIDCESVNSVTLHMTDGTSFTLEVECIIPNLNLYGLSIMEEKEKPDSWYSGN